MRVFSLEWRRALREAFLIFQISTADVNERTIRLTSLLGLNNAGLSGITLRLGFKYIYLSQYNSYRGFHRLLIVDVFFQGRGASNCWKYSVGSNFSNLYV